MCVYIYIYIFQSCRLPNSMALACFSWWLLMSNLILTQLVSHLLWSPFSAALLRWCLLPLHSCCPISLIVLHQAFDHGANEVGTDDMDVEVEKKKNPELQGGFSCGLQIAAKNYCESKMMPCETCNSSIKKRCHSWLFPHPAASHAPCFGIELLPWPQTYLRQSFHRTFHTFTLGRPPNRMKWKKHRVTYWFCCFGLPWAYTMIGTFIFGTIMYVSVKGPTKDMQVLWIRSS